MQDIDLAGPPAAKRLGHWTFAHYSTICLDDDGVGCDDCACPCHGPYAPEFLTYKDVAEWHTKEEAWELAGDGTVIPAKRVES